MTGNDIDPRKIITCLGTYTQEYDRSISDAEALAGAWRQVEEWFAPEQQFTREQIGQLQAFVESMASTLNEFAATRQ